jgi:hypothetical protein
MAGMAVKHFRKSTKIESTMRGKIAIIRDSKMKSKKGKEK